MPPAQQLTRGSHRSTKRHQTAGKRGVGCGSCLGCSNSLTPAALGATQQGASRDGTPTGTNLASSHVAEVGLDHRLPQQLGGLHSRRSRRRHETSHRGSVWRRLGTMAGAACAAASAAATSWTHGRPMATAGCLWVLLPPAPTRPSISSGVASRKPAPHASGAKVASSNGTAALQQGKPDRNGTGGVGETDARGRGRARAAPGGRWLHHAGPHPQAAWGGGGRAARQQPRRLQWQQLTWCAGTARCPPRSGGSRCRWCQHP